MVATEPISWIATLSPRHFTPGFEKRVSGKSLAAILAVGAAYVADPDRHPLIFWVTVVLCVVALASAMTMLVLLGDETLARHLYDWAPSGIDEATAYGKAANLMLGGFIAWVLGVLSVQVGLKLS